MIKTDPVEADSQNKFLSKILLEPDVDAHKLVYADWLQEFAKRSPCSTCESCETKGCASIHRQSSNHLTKDCCQAKDCFEGYITDGRWERAEFIHCTDDIRKLKLYTKFKIDWFGYKMTQIIGTDMGMIKNGFVSTLKCQCRTMPQYLKWALYHQPICQLVLTDARLIRNNIYCYWLTHSSGDFLSTVEEIIETVTPHAYPLGYVGCELPDDVRLFLKHLNGYTNLEDAQQDLKQALNEYLKYLRTRQKAFNFGI